MSRRSSGEDKLSGGAGGRVRFHEVASPALWNSTHVLRSQAQSWMVAAANRLSTAHCIDSVAQACPACPRSWTSSFHQAATTVTSKHRRNDRPDGFSRRLLGNDDLEAGFFQGLGVGFRNPVVGDDLMNAGHGRNQGEAAAPEFAGVAHQDGTAGNL